MRLEPFDVAGEELFVERHLRQRPGAVFLGENPVGPAGALELTAARHVVHLSPNSDEERFSRIQAIVADELRERVIPLFRFGQRRARHLLLPAQPGNEAT